MDLTSEASSTTKVQSSFHYTELGLNISDFICRLFVYLTVIALVMTVINLLQATLINHVNNFLWMTVFPLVIFLALLAAVVIHMSFSRTELLVTWQQAKGKCTLRYIQKLT